MSGIPYLPFIESRPDGSIRRTFPYTLDREEAFLDGLRLSTFAEAPSPTAMWGIDTPQDAEHAEKLIAEHGEPLVGLDK